MTATGADVAVDWINAPTGFYRTQIYRNTTTSFGTATLIATVAGVAGKVSDYIDTPGGTGARRYWVVTVNGSGVQSLPVGPVTVTL